jgi:hypothetical protein
MSDTTPGAWDRVLVLTINEPRTRRAALRMFPTVTDADLDELARLWHSSQTGATWAKARELVEAWKTAGSPRHRDPVGDE